ncbi:MAG: hypothetical protein AB7F86_19940 [Bdellovibrionales bacterium]
MRFLAHLKQSGRVHPLLLGLLILAIGLSVNRWWWQIGAVLILIVLVESVLRYREN